MSLLGQMPLKLAQLEEEQQKVIRANTYEQQQALALEGYIQT